MDKKYQYEVEPLPRILMDFYWGGISRIEFRTPHFDRDGENISLCSKLAQK
jgi:hypothetical protein